MTKATSLATQTETLPIVSDDFSAFEGLSTGFENVKATDLLIPRLTILQGLSPQVTIGKAEYDTNAKVGDVYDVGLQERFPSGVSFIPVHYQKQWLQWAPRASGKGLQGIHETDAILKDTHEDDKGRAILPNGDYVTETAQLYGLNINAGYRKCFLPMASTQLKKARRLLTLATSEKIERADGTFFTPPLYYRSYNLTTVPESNNEGNWMGWKIERSSALTELPNWKALLQDITTFRESLVKGEAKGDLSGIDGERPSRDQSADAPF